MIELKSAVCPECGGRLVIDPLSPNTGKCKSCGYTALISGVPGFNAEKAAWINAVNALEDGDFDKADNFFKKILETKPEYGEAHFGRFECAVAAAEYYKRLNSQMARCLSDYSNSINEAVNKYGKRATQYAADETTKQGYQTRIDEVLITLKAYLDAAEKKERNKTFWEKLFG